MARGPTSGRDATGWLVLLLVLLMLLPAALVVPGAGSVGRPAVLLCLVFAAWWVVSRLHPGLARPGGQPLRWAALAFAASTLASYAVAYRRGMPPVEAAGADAALLGVSALLGVLLLAADGIGTRRRLDQLVQALVLTAAGTALVGWVQIASGVDVSAYLVPPGLTLHSDLVGFRPRGDGFLQVAATTSHYIEFSAVMAMAVPYAVHVARFAPGRRRRRLGWVCVVVCAAVVPATLSRTGVLALLTGLAVTALAWSWRHRYQALVAAAALTGALMVVRPGLLGTLRSLFLQGSQDPSIQGRLDDYPVVAAYFAARPWLGRGPGTFVPDLHPILDNQWLGTLVSTGLVGVAALAGVHLTAIALAVATWRRACTERDRHLCAVLVSSQVIAVVCGFTFDSLGFGTFATLVFLLAGTSGAFWRLHRRPTDRSVEPAAA